MNCFDFWWGLGRVARLLVWPDYLWDTLRAYCLLSIYLGVLPVILVLSRSSKIRESTLLSCSCCATESLRLGRADSYALGRGVPSLMLTRGLPVLSVKSRLRESDPCMAA